MDDLLRVLIDRADISVAVLSTLAVIVSAALTSFAALRRSHDREQLAARVGEVVEAVRVAPTTPASKQTHEKEWQLIQELVRDYHEQALAQARYQFWFSVVAAIAGFAMISTSLWPRGTAEGAETTQLVQTMPGILVEAVAALFFRQATETRNRATELYDRLRADRQRMDSIALVESIEDSGVRSKTKAAIALHLAGLSDSARRDAIEATQVPDGKPGPTTTA